MCVCVCADSAAKLHFTDPVNEKYNSDWIPDVACTLCFQSVFQWWYAAKRLLTHIVLIQIMCVLMCVRNSKTLRKIYLDTIMRPQEGCTFNQVNIWHITPARLPARLPACLCLALPSRKPGCLCRLWGIASVPKIKFEWSKFSSKLRNGVLFSTNITILTCYFFFMTEIHSVPHTPVCLHLFVRTSDKCKRYQLWGNLPNGAYCRSVCTCVRVCVFEVPQRYQILADMPNWTYCRLGRWRGPKRSFGNNVPPSPLGGRITKTFSSQEKKEKVKD